MDIKPTKYFIIFNHATLSKMPGSEKARKLGSMGITDVQLSYDLSPLQLNKLIKLAPGFQAS